MSKSPLAVVNETFGGKDKLVDKLVGLLETGDESKEDLKKRLSGVANRKLIRMHVVATTVGEKYGSRDKLITQAATNLGRHKDKDYVTSLGNYSTARLVDIAAAAERRQKRLAAKAAKAPAKPAKAAKPAQTDKKAGKAAKAQAAAK